MFVCVVDVHHQKNGGKESPFAEKLTYHIVFLLSAQSLSNLCWLT